MHARSLLLTGIVAFLLSACATLPPEMRFQTKQDCKPNKDNCEVEVNPWTGLVPEHLELPMGTSSVIHWVIPRGWLRFKTPGIVFASNANGIITCNPNPTGDERKVTCRNTGAPNDAGYKYTVRLNFFDYDPFVWNR